MKKVVIFLILLSCSTNDDVQIQTEPTTIPTNTTVFRAMDPEVAFANFVDYWNKNLKSYRPLSDDELKTTNDLRWPDYIIVNDSITCNMRVKGTLSTGVADENHPIEFDSFQNVQWWLTESYVCNDDLITNLYGPPFFQDNEWWIFAATNYPGNLGTDSLYKECRYPCSPVAAVRFASRVSIDVSEDSTTTSTTVADSTTTSTTTTTVADSTTTTVADSTTTTVVSVDYPQLTISEIPSSIPEYDRDDWNHWIDENGDCQNTRHEVLIEESFESVTYTSDTYCSVSTGKWYGNYTGQYYFNASELDIDHFIPLKNAHQSGGYNWSSAKKEEFANYKLDPDNLIAVNLSANRSKGAKGPDEWKPSNTEYWCEYAYDWIRIKDYWNLTATQAEWDALVSMIETCPEVFTYADAEEEPIVELPAPTITVASSQPDNPGNTKNCGDFSNYSEAKSWFDTYYPYYGDVGDLDRDGDLIPCESLPGAP